MRGVILWSSLNYRRSFAGADLVQYQSGNKTMSIDQLGTSRIALCD